MPNLDHKIIIRKGSRRCGGAMALALAALPPCGKCRRLEPKEKPLERCVLYRHKEDLRTKEEPAFGVAGL